MGTLWTLQSSQPGLSLYSALPMAYGTSYYVISLSVNIVLTILISARLLMYRRRVSTTLKIDSGQHYVSLATIFIESAALYSVFALLFIITYAINNPINQIFLTIASSCQVWMSPLYQKIFSRLRNVTLHTANRWLLDHLPPCRRSRMEPRDTR